MSEAISQNEFKELSPLICGKCGSAVPLPDGDKVPCIHCGNSVDVPPEYQRGRQARARLESIRNHAQAFLQRIGRLPGRFEVLLSKIPSYAFFVILIIATITIFRAFMLVCENYLSRLIGVNLWDYLPELISVLLNFGSFFLFFASAMALYFYVRRRVFVTRRLLSVLAAGEPATPGGPATCRRCGAPFLVEENELVAACDYCGTENFLQVPHEWISATRRLTSSSGRNVFWAEREYEREVESGRRSFFSQAMILAAFLIMLGGAYLQSDSNKVQLWRDEIEKKPRQIYAPIPDFPPPLLGESFKVHGIYRRFSSGRHFTYRIALKKNERLRFSQLEGKPMHAAMRCSFFPTKKSFSPDAPVELTAEIGGWYDLSLITSYDDAVPTVKVELISE